MIKEPPARSSSNGPATAAAPPVAREISSATLFAAGRELLIRHGRELYRLRLTSNDKLILTK